MTKVEVEVSNVKEVTTDDRGRAYLGSELKDSTVQVAILEVEEEDNTDS